MGTKYGGAVTIWSSNLNHVIGDYPGEPTKVVAGAGVIAAGFIPGDIYAPTAEETNNELNYYSKILAWVQEGSSANGVNTHIVETNATGDISVRRGSFFTDGAFLNAVTGEATGGGSGVYGRSNSNGVTGEAVFGGSGYGGRFFASSNSGGVRGLGSGVGYGGYFTAGSSGVGVRAEGGGSGGAGLEAVGDGGEPDIFLQPFENWGIDINNFATAQGGIRVLANGQLGISVSQNDPNFPACAFFGDNAAASNQETLEVRAFGSGDALAGYATTGSGWPLRLYPKTAGPSVGAIRVATQSARPSITTTGQLTQVNEGSGHWIESCFADAFDPGPGAGWRGMWSTVGGLALARTFAPGLVWAALAGAYEIMVTMTAQGGNAPKIGGRIGMFALSFQARVYDTTSLQRINVKVRDTTSGVDIYKREGAGAGSTAGIYLPPLATSGYRAPITLLFSAVIPAAGTRSWNLQLANTDTMDIRDVCLELLGLM